MGGAAWGELLAKERAGRATSLQLYAHGTTDAVTRKTMRQIIDQGWSNTLEAGLAIEKEANRAHADAELRAEGVADKREQVRERGQSQSDD